MKYIEKIESAQIRDKDTGEVIMTFNNSPTLTIKMDNATVSNSFGEMMKKISEAMGTVGVSAEEAGRALQKTVRVFDDEKQEYRNTIDIFEDLARRWNEIGCINAATPEEISQGLLRAETPGTTENSNQKTDFNFLEQNDQEEDNPFLAAAGEIGFITPFDDK